MPTLRELGEFEAIRLLTRDRAERAGVIVGPGDDAAVLRFDPGEDLVATTDALIEGRHFLPAWMTPAERGSRLAAANLSDLAAMAARPRWALLSIGARPDHEMGALLEFQRFDDQVRSAGSLLLSGEIALGFSHEMYNKVSGLELMLQNLLPQVNNPDELRPGLASLGEMVRDMKNIAGTFQQITHVLAKREPLDVNEILRRADMLLRPMARKARVTIALHLDQDLPRALGYASWLQQIFLNLMLNAVQQTALKADEHRLLEVKTTFDENDPELVKVRFTDSGPGIHKQLWDRIFTLGFTTRLGGTGLGLFLVRSLLEGIEGRVRVEESFMLSGTTFLVELPAVERGMSA